MGSQLSTYYLYQYMVGIVPGNAMLKALGGISFMCLLGRYMSHK